MDFPFGNIVYIKLKFCKFIKNFLLPYLVIVFFKGLKKFSYIFFTFIVICIISNNF